MYRPSRRRRGPRGVALILAAAVAGTTAGCQRTDADSSRDRPPPDAGLSEPAARTRQGDPGIPQRAARTKSGSTRTSQGDSQTIVTGAGSAYRVPTPPRALAITPGKTCTRPQGASGKQQRLAIPPAPGLVAQRLSDSQIRVIYRFNRVPPICEPVRLKLSVDVSRDTLPGSASYVRIFRKRGVITVAIPPDLRDADVLRATAFTRKLVQSRSAAVLIR